MLPTDKVSKKLSAPLSASKNDLATNGVVMFTLIVGFVGILSFYIEKISKEKILCSPVAEICIFCLQLCRCHAHLSGKYHALFD